LGLDEARISFLGFFEFFEFRNGGYGCEIYLDLTG
jgi:hypothetical protein